MSALRVLAVVVGAFVVFYDLWDLVRALIVPRPYTAGPVAGATRALRRIMHRVVWRRRSFEAVDCADWTPSATAPRVTSTGPTAE